MNKLEVFGWAVVALVFIFFAVKLGTFAFYRGRQLALDFQKKKENEHK